MKHQESELFFRYHRGLCTKAEKDEVEKLLNGSEAYRLQFLDSKIAWALGEDIKLMEAVDAELGYKKIKADIRAKKIRIFQERLVRYAAFLTIPLLLSSMALGYLYFKKPDEKIQYTNITATVGSVVRYAAYPVQDNQADLPVNKICLSLPAKDNPDPDTFRPIL